VVREVERKSGSRGRKEELERESLGLKARSKSEARVWIFEEIEVRGIVLFHN